MATGSHPQNGMPGLFTPPSFNGRSGSRQDYFVIDSAATSGTRKRSRHNDLNPSRLPSQPPVANHGWTDSSLGSSRFSNARSPPPLANDRYELAGGIMEGPNMFTRHNGDYDDYYHLEKQRGMWSLPTSPVSGLTKQHLSDPATESSPNGTKPWMLNQILNIVGGVAGKLVQFCSGPFRGFQAGGGQAYRFNPECEITTAESLEDPFGQDTAAPIQRPLPGEFPEDNYGVASIESLEDSRPRMSKRLRTGESWVVVDRDCEMDSRPSSPRLSERRVPGIHARSPSQIPRPVSRTSNSHATPKRPSLIPVSRRSTLDRRLSQGGARSSTNPCSTPRSYSRQSYGSPVMFQSKKTTSPLPPESQRLINKMRHEEMEDDARMRRMSSQMSTMLREAREALGSKFEIEDDYMDHGGLDDEGFSESTSWHKR
ncbi:hypothetical protein K469DRAFT_729825 [Zopfia rhizophila CBS 207.26]|uniref:Uncharacterized protein n=1 Tax=Zopfia rhizophila CBS 207.26 TaxID=1314779 RepID=A0A6A6DNH0_9PEZI|nr:hypothetical protein K469DRAFT_729825 [Zopfia rhizophila CBS 207.26]